MNESVKFPFKYKRINYTFYLKFIPNFYLVFYFQVIGVWKLWKEKYTYYYDTLCSPLQRLNWLFKIWQILPNRKNDVLRWPVKRIYKNSKLFEKWSFFHIRVAKFERSGGTCWNFAIRIIKLKTLFNLE